MLLSSRLMALCRPFLPASHMSSHSPTVSLLVRSRPWLRRLRVASMFGSGAFSSATFSSNSAIWARPSASSVSARPSRARTWSRSAWAALRLS